MIIHTYEIRLVVTHQGGEMRTMGVNLTSRSGSFVSSAAISIKPLRLVARSLNSCIHELRSEYVRRCLLRLMRQQLLTTMALKQLHSGTYSGRLYFSLTWASRSSTLRLMDYIRSRNSAESPWKALSETMILEMQSLYSNLELVSLLFILCSAFQFSDRRYQSSTRAKSCNGRAVAELSDFYRPSANMCRRQMSALGKLKSGSSGNLLSETSLAFLLTCFLNSRGSWRGMVKSSRMRSRWKSFFLILEFMRILLDMLETRAAKLIPSLNHSWLITRWISASDTTFLPQKLSRVPTQAQYSFLRPRSLRCSIIGMKIFLGQFFQKARWRLAESQREESYSSEEGRRGRL